MSPCYQFPGQTELLLSHQLRFLSGDLAHLSWRWVCRAPHCHPTEKWGSYILLSHWLAHAFILQLDDLALRSPCVCGLFLERSPYPKNAHTQALIKIGPSPSELDLLWRCYGLAFRIHVRDKGIKMTKIGNKLCFFSWISGFQFILVLILTPVKRRRASLWQD